MVKTKRFFATLSTFSGSGACAQLLVLLKSSSVIRAASGGLTAPTSSVGVSRLVALKYTNGFSGGGHELSV